MSIGTSQLVKAESNITATNEHRLTNWMCKDCDWLVTEIIQS